MNLVERNNDIVGFRPEHLLPKEVHETSEHLVTFQFHLSRVEHLGAGRLLYGLIGAPFADQKVIANLASNVMNLFQPEMSYTFAVKTANLKFFDRATGLRIEPRPL